MKFFIVVLSVFVSVLAAGVMLFYLYLAPSNASVQTVFVVPQQSASFDVPSELARQNLVKSEAGFRFLYNFLVAGKTTAPGGYRLDGNMHAWETIRHLSARPDFLWVTVPEGLRKEQVGILLADKLGWPDSYKGEWNRVYEESDQYREGVYFPDTYLFPHEETPEQIAGRFVDRFNEKAGPYLNKFASRNLTLKEGITIASLIERETGNPAEMPLISGVIHNRLSDGMRLQIDATIQYAMGNNESGWWPRVRGSDTRTVVSPYNTYHHDGLPPGPIASPGLAAIAAAANPTETECMFYLHSNKIMYCAETYDKHLENIERYLN